MSRKYLFAILFLILGTSTANANVVWPGLYISTGLKSAWCIVGRLLVEIGFVKYFTECSWLKTVFVSIVMNIASTILGIMVIVGSCAVMLLCPGIDSVIYINPDHWSIWLFYYIFSATIITLIEGGVIKLILKLKFKDTYKWLAVANAISIIMCAIYVAVGGPGLQ